MLIMQWYSPFFPQSPMSIWLTSAPMYIAEEFEINQRTLEWQTAVQCFSACRAPEPTHYTCQNHHVLKWEHDGSVSHWNTWPARPKTQVRAGFSEIYLRLYLGLKFFHCFTPSASIYEIPTMCQAWHYSRTRETKTPPSKRKRQYYLRIPTISNYLK